MFVRLGLFIFSIYALLVFIITLLIALPCYIVVFNVFPKKRSPHIAHKISQLWAKIVFLLFFIRVKVKNKEFIQPDQTYIFISNHQSQLDIPLAACACKNTFRFLAKAELSKIPLLGYIIRNLYITVNRTDKSDRTKSIDVMIKSLHAGISVIIYPEGTRNREHEGLLDFKDGAFRLAVQSSTPIAVLTIINSRKRLSPMDFFQLSPGAIYAIWDAPISTVGLTTADVPALKEKVRQLMLSHFKTFSLEKFTL